MSLDRQVTDSQVKKAGRMLRRYLRDEQAYTNEQIAGALRVVDEFRASHQLPLVTANNGLRSMVRTSGYEVEVSQRLKRFPTIVDKLLREPSLSLSKMQDIGGCRAILGSVDELRVVEKRIRHRRPPVDYSDYIAAPRTSGYRALHLVVEYSGRKIEIQLRTRAMHEWALTVERLSSRVSRNLKGEGEHVLQRLMAVISDAMALEEAGQHVDTRLQSRIVELRESAKPYLSGGS